MTAQSEKLYLETFECIRKLLPRFNPEKFLCDFERGLANAIEQVWPDAQLHGCLFHYTQALYRKFRGLGGPTLFKGKEVVFDWLTHLYVLPHVPHEQISELLKDLDPDVFFNDQEWLDLVLLKRFYDYFISFWVKSVTPKRFSVFDSPWRTNKDLESYHSQLDKKN